MMLIVDFLMYINEKTDEMNAQNSQFYHKQLPEPDLQMFIQFLFISALLNI